MAGKGRFSMVPGHHWPGCRCGLHSNQYGFQQQHSPQTVTWPQEAAQTVDIHMAFGANLDQGHQEQTPWWQPGSGHHNGPRWLLRVLTTLISPRMGVWVSGVPLRHYSSITLSLSSHLAVVSSGHVS